MVGARVVSATLRLLAMNHVRVKIWVTTVAFIMRSATGSLGKAEIHCPDFIVCALGGCEKRPLEEREAM